MYNFKESSTNWLPWKPRSRKGRKSWNKTKGEVQKAMARVPEIKSQCRGWTEAETILEAEKARVVSVGPCSRKVLWTSAS